MKILFNMTSDSELICFESLSLAFVLATFDHQLQLRLTPNTLVVLSDSNSRLFGMIQSISLYDLPDIWVDDLTQFQDLPEKILDKLIPTPIEIFDNADHHFDAILTG